MATAVGAWLAGGGGCLPARWLLHSLRMRMRMCSARASKQQHACIMEMEGRMERAPGTGRKVKHVLFKVRRSSSLDSPPWQLRHDHRAQQRLPVALHGRGHQILIQLQILQVGRSGLRIL